MKKALITGAAGNLGGLLANYLKDSGLILNLLIHKKEIDPKLKGIPNINVFKADLGNKDTLASALKNVDVVIHFAGVLFKHNPEKFLPLTNTLYFSNLIEKAVESKVKRIILISFPHVEGETTPENPATGCLNGNPISVHAKTRLEEEKLLFSMGAETNIEAVSLRVGMVYGRGILMIDTAHKLAKNRLLGIWEKPTWIHLISTPDFLESTTQAVIKENITGIYHLGDEGQQTLQEFLDSATKQWGYKPPLRMPVGLIMFAAKVLELSSFLFAIKSPLTKDFIKIGMVSYYGDTHRMRRELLKDLKYKTYKEGIETL
ncbi:NAD(P)-dependent oxidoreductase [bacterium]|nr:NAD(P)-dependent oxidoreductase [bacterium]